MNKQTLRQIHQGLADDYQALEGQVKNLPDEHPAKIHVTALRYALSFIKQSMKTGLMPVKAKAENEFTKDSPLVRKIKEILIGKQAGYFGAHPTLPGYIQYNPRKPSDYDPAQDPELTVSPDQTATKKPTPSLRIPPKPEDREYGTRKPDDWLKRKK